MTKVKKKELMSKEVRTRLSPAQYEAFWQRYQESTCQSLSGYIRDVLTSPKISIKWRNESLENFLESAIDIKNDLHKVIESERHDDLKETVFTILTLMQKIYKECAHK